MANIIKAIIIKEESGDIGSCGCVIIAIILLFVSGAGGFLIRQFWVITKGEEETRMVEVQKEITKLRSEVDEAEKQRSHGDPFAMKDDAFNTKLNRIKELESEKNLLRIEIEKDKIIPEKSSELGIQSSNEEHVDLSQIILPRSFITTHDTLLLEANATEALIPANTKVTIQKRSESGVLTLEINGKTYVGNESRIEGKIRSFLN